MKMKKCLLIATAAAVIMSMAACAGGSNGYAPAGGSDLFDLYDSRGDSGSGLFSGTKLESERDFAASTYTDESLNYAEGQGLAKPKELGTADAAVVDYGQSADALNEKLIYTAEVSVESLDFDETVNSFLEIAKVYKAFFESSYVSGMINSDVKARQPRYANYTVRVPKGHFQDMLDRFYEIGNVLYARSHAENITTQFFDTESRLSTYRIEESRLLAMLEKADTVDDMIKIESRLSDVRYQIESLTTTLRNWQSQVDYSTIEISIKEVTKISESAPLRQTYGQELRSGAAASFGAVGDFFKLLLKYIVMATPLLLIAAVVLVAVLWRRKRKRKA
ncbi:MAG: DUF4349 domain-containing protein [Clostridiales bacterium]|nr:DUF4349 domain-containing protein [Clostridiales bacterium]